MTAAGEIEVTPLARSYVARALSLLACVAFVVMMLDERTVSLLWMAYLCIFAVAATFGASVGAYRARSAFAAHIDGEGIRRDGVLVVDRAKLASGRVVSRPIWMTAKLLRLEGRAGAPSYIFRVADEATGEAMLEQLHLDAGHVRVKRVLPWIPFGRVDGHTFIMLTGAWTVLFVPMLALAFDGPTPAHELASTIALIVGLALHLTFWITLRLRSPVALEIGHDGLAITSGILRRRTRLLAYEEVTALRSWKTPSGPAAVPQGIDVMLQHGEPVRLHTRSTANHGAVDEVAAAIDKAWARYRQRRAQGTATAAPELGLERDGRALEAWAAHLSTVGRGAAGYRDLPAERQGLLDVLDDPTAATELRAAAAFALGAAPEPELHDRVRIAADTVASPDLRATLEELASAEDDAAERVEALRRMQR